MATNFHNNAFDEGTLLKLEIYKKYVTAWLPVFIARPIDKFWNGRINIFDFFCGPGKDSNGVEGSPILAIDSSLEYRQLLQEKNKVVHLFFNDDMPTKIAQLNKTLSQQTLPDSIRYITSSSSFSDAFRDLRSPMQRAANLIFIDQCGVKEVTGDVFQELTKMMRTDFLFFFASSYFRRFRESKEFKAYLDASGHMDAETTHQDSHRAIASMYRSMIPKETNYYLGSFSIKKGRNIYGLIFGSGNLLGIEKFLRICWELDPERGAANFDIDDDHIPQKGDSLHLFQENTVASKVVSFQSELREKLLNNQMKTDSAVFRYALENGFLPGQHAKSVVTSLIKEGAMRCDGQPRLGNACLKKPRTLTLC